MRTTAPRQDRMQIEISFPGGDRVDAHFGGFTVPTDQPSPQGNRGAAPSPFALFLTSIATCAGIYVLRFCQERGLPTEGLRILQRSVRDPATDLVGRIELQIQLPPGFPERYRSALVRSAELCAVKKHLEHPPAFEITTEVAQAIAG